MSKVNNEEHPKYAAGAGAGINKIIPIPSRHAGDETIRIALNTLASRLKQPHGLTVTCPEDVKSYLKMKLMPLEHEVFAIMFLNNQHQLIDFQEMFRGTIDSASVYPREVVKEALKQNAAAIIVAHNHPSGDPEPSKNDERITHRLKDACNLLQIRLLDHIIVGGMDTVSLADRGIL